jgi:hypothetical protein
MEGLNKTLKKSVKAVGLPSEILNRSLTNTGPRRSMVPRSLLGAYQCFVGTRLLHFHNSVFLCNVDRHLHVCKVSQPRGPEPELSLKTPRLILRWDKQWQAWLLLATTLGRLVMMDWDWRLRTAASTGLLFMMWTMIGWYWLRLIPNVSIRALWKPPVLSGGPTIRDISGASGRVGEENENLVYPSPWDFKIYFTCRKILRHGTSGFISHPKEGMLPLKVRHLGRAWTHNLWVQWQAH